MKIRIIAKTQFEPFDEWGDLPGKAKGSAFEDRLYRGSLDGQELIEFAGRLCYESWDLPNPKTATNSGYIDNIIDHGHFSILEHVSVTFYVEGVSRNLSHELIRHRHISPSELSQRFVDMSDARMVVPPAANREVHGITVPLDAENLRRYKALVEEFEDGGKTRKQAREAARFVLPSGMETKLVLSGNLRAWRELIPKRKSKHADAEMQLFAEEIGRQLLAEYPDVFKDLFDEGS